MKIFLALLTTIYSISISCQQDNITPVTEELETPRKNALFLEIAGNGALVSLSYDRLLYSEGQHSIHGRLGYGFLFNIIFIEGSYVYGKKHCLEHGLSYGHGLVDDMSTYWDMYYRLGYRYQGKKGLLVRVAPLVQYNKFSGFSNPFSLWYGVSFGYSF